MLIAEILRYVLQNNVYFCKVRKWFVKITSNGMDLNATIDIIIKDLNELREIIDDLKRYQGVPVFQIELAKSKCKSAAEVISLLKDLPDKTVDHREEISREKEKLIVKEDPIVRKEEIRREESRVSASSLSFTAGEEIKREVVKIRPVEEPDINIEPVPAVSRITETAIIADQFSNRPESFNEMLGSTKQDDLSEIMKTKPLTNLSEAIGINDKFFFIREIFKGNTDTYNIAIAKLDSAGNLNDAREVIAGYTGGNTDNEAIRQLMDLLKRKFHSDE